MPAFIEANAYTPLVHAPAAVCCAAATRNLLLLERELVVVRDLFAAKQRSTREDNYLLLALHLNDLGVRVGLEQHHTDATHQSTEHASDSNGRTTLQHTSVPDPRQHAQRTYIAGVVDEPRRTAMRRCVDDVVPIEAKQVARSRARLLVAASASTVHVLVTTVTTTNAHQRTTPTRLLACRPRSVE
jgi:hypothetical protein